MPYHYQLKNKICEVCGEIYLPTSTRQKICTSYLCKNIKHNDHGKTYYQKNSKIIYEKTKTKNDEKYSRQRARRLLVKMGVNFICQLCHKKDCLLDVHHKDGNPFNNVISNLAIVCRGCHRKIHRQQIV